MTVAELTVKLSADISGLRDGLIRARAEIQGFSESVKGSSGDVERFASSTERLSGDVRDARAEFERWSSKIPIVGGLLGSLSRHLDPLNGGILRTTGSLFQMIPGLQGVGQQVSQMAASELPAFISEWEILPVVIFAAVAAAYAVADAFGTVLAIVGDLIAPLGVVGGLLGALGIGFVLAGKRALDGGKQFSQLHHVVDQVKSKFEELTTTLAHRFMPIFLQLGQDAGHALDFLERIAKLPLNDAFRKLAQQGIPAIQRFLDQVGSMVAKPIRLAFQIAFGTGKAGNEASSFVSNLWNQLEHFWLGYTKTKTLRFGNGRVLQITQKQVNGALQPFLDWFNRHNFTKQGAKIGDEILSGLKRISKPVASWLVSVLEIAAHQAFDALLRIGANALNSLKDLAVRTFHEDAAALRGGMDTAWNAVRSLAGHVWSAIRSAASSSVGSIAGRIRGVLSSAWNAVLGAAERVWNRIVSIIESPLHVNIDWPSPPSWLGSVGGFIHKHLATGGMLSPGEPAVVGERGPELFIPAGAGTIVPNHRSFGGGGGGAAVNVNLHFHGGMWDRADARRIARELKPELDRIVILNPARRR